MPAGNVSTIQRPPLRQNYAISCKGIITNQDNFVQPLGFVGNIGCAPAISSLYETQLSNRLINGDRTDVPARFSIKEEDENITISWLDIADNETEYIIKTSEDGVNFTTFATVSANETSYTFSVDQLTNLIAYFRMYVQSATYPSANTHAILLDVTGNSEYIKNPLSHTRKWISFIEIY